MPGFDSFLSTPATGPTYTDLAWEVDALKADNAALPEFCARVAFQAVQRAEWGHNLPRGMTLEQYVPYEVAEAVTQRPHPGASLLDEITTLREQVQRLIAGQQRASETRQAAFLELAEELAELTPEKRDAAIRRIIDQRNA